MSTNEAVVDVDEKAIITPLLLDSNGVVIPWDIAIANHNAICLWEDLANAQPFGEFTVYQNGVAKFKPTSVGIFTVKCVVNYRDPDTLTTQVVNGFLIVTVPTMRACDITIQYTPFIVNLSTKPNNRITKDAIGALFVPEVDIDLVNYYMLSQT